MTEFEDSFQVIGYLRERLGSNDVVLVKGSHGMRMDRIVAALEGIDSNASRTFLAIMKKRSSQFKKNISLLEKVYQHQ